MGLWQRVHDELHDGVISVGFGSGGVIFDIVAPVVLHMGISKNLLLE